MANILDFIIIGGGPAGYTAALYSARAGFKGLLLEKVAPGGQMGTTDRIDNYPGFPQGINGFDLGLQMQQGAHRFGVETKMLEVKSVDLIGETKVVYTTLGEFSAKSVIIATGAQPRELGLAEEKELRGRGISYCATCDGMFYKDKIVAVIGGGNTAVSDVIYLAKICKKVYLIHRRGKLRASSIYKAQLESFHNVEFIWNSEVRKVLHDEKVSGVNINDNVSGKEHVKEMDGVFVAIGNKPNSELFIGQIDLSENRYIIADETTRTNIPGVFAVGDIREKSLRQIVTAVSDGAVASKYMEEYLTLKN